MEPVPMTNHHHLLVVEPPEANLSRRSSGSMSDMPSISISNGRGMELEEHFGNISGAAITMRHKVVAERRTKDKKLCSRIKRLEKQIINI